jgi:LemA protein
MLALLIAIGFAVVVGAFVWLTYNRMVARRNAADNSWSQIDVELKRRHDLIPSLVEAVRGYAGHERATLERVTEARSEAIVAHWPPQRAAAEGTLSAVLGRLLAIAEDYPQLRASENFGELQADLSGTEDRIAIARRVYNDTVQTYNTLIQIFPAVIVARLFGFTPREFFDAPSEVEIPPEVRYSAIAQARGAASGSPPPTAAGGASAAAPAER